MALGQSGPPASPKQVSYLEALLEKAGYASFREARRAYSLTQRQAGGKFTKQERPEVVALVERAADAVEEWVGAGIESAMNRFN